MRLRQVCLVAERLEPTVSTLASLLDAEVCYRDPGVAFLGQENAQLPVGATVPSGSGQPSCRVVGAGTKHHTHNPTCQACLTL